MKDHERIWLQHPDDVDDSEGRCWCEDDGMWEHPGIEYVRADLVRDMERGLAEIRKIVQHSVFEENIRIRNLCDVLLARKGGA